MFIRRNHAGRRRFFDQLGKAGTAAWVMGSTMGFGARYAAAQAPDKIMIGYLPVNAETVIFRGGTDFWKQQGLNVEPYRVGLF